jgi:hypothetical protein
MSLRILTLHYVIPCSPYPQLHIDSDNACNIFRPLCLSRLIHAKSDRRRRYSAIFSRHRGGHNIPLDCRYFPGYVLFREIRRDSCRAEPSALQSKAFSTIYYAMSSLLLRRSTHIIPSTTLSVVCQYILIIGPW